MLTTSRASRDRTARLVTRAGADFEHAVLRPDFQLLRHVGDDVGLTDGLAARDRQRLIGVGAVGELRGDKMLARNRVHGAQHRLIADARGDAA